MVQLSVYAANENGVQALRAMSNALYAAVNEIANHTARIINVSDEYCDTIGPHKTSLDQAIEEISDCIRRSGEPANDIAERLSEVAEGYQEVIDNDQLNVNSSVGVSSGDSRTGPLFGRIFSSSKDNASTNKFGSFDTGKYNNGDTVVKGDHFEQYIADYYDYENSTYTSLSDNPIVETISPSAIEGIHLGTIEASDPARFWGQHETGGTADSFKEIASHIPEVKAQLDSGRPLSDIQADPVLGRCADIYFEPSSIPRVVKNNGYYEFDSNGRHRILAARELGYDIPVKVIGIRTRK